MAARFPMAVVVTGSPLTVTVEGASAVVAAEDFVGNLKTGDRVQAAFLGDRLVVQQLAGGPPQSTAATANTLALRDASARIKAANGVAADDVATVGQLPNPAWPDRMVSCTIQRVNSTTWAVINNTAHRPLGVLSVVLYSTYVRVNYDFTAVHVSSVQVTPDESFAAPDVRVGTSVGLSYMNIYFYMGTSSTPVDPSLLSTAGANVWITGTFFSD